MSNSLRMSKMQTHGTNCHRRKLRGAEDPQVGRSSRRTRRRWLGSEVSGENRPGKVRGCGLLCLWLLLWNISCCAQWLSISSMNSQKKCYLNIIINHFICLLAFAKHRWVLWECMWTSKRGSTSGLNTWRKTSAAFCSRDTWWPTGRITSNWRCP